MSTLPVPEHWSPRQALAYLELLEDLHQAIWDAYEDVLVDLIIADLNALDDTDDSPDFEDDDVPW